MKLTSTFFRHPISLRVTYRIRTAAHHYRSLSASASSAAAAAAGARYRSLTVKLAITQRLVITRDYILHSRPWMTTWLDAMQGVHDRSLCLSVYLSIWLTGVFCCSVHSLVWVSYAWTTSWTGCLLFSVGSLFDVQHRHDMSSMWLMLKVKFKQVYKCVLMKRLPALVQIDLLFWMR